MSLPIGSTIHTLFSHTLWNHSSGPYFGCPGQFVPWADITLWGFMSQHRVLISASEQIGTLATVLEGRAQAESWSCWGFISCWKTWELICYWAPCPGKQEREISGQIGWLSHDKIIISFYHWKQTKTESKAFVFQNKVNFLVVLFRKYPLITIWETGKGWYPRPQFQCCLAE